MKNHYLRQNINSLFNFTSYSYIDKILEDKNLYALFEEAVTKVCDENDKDILHTVHLMLVRKVYNARCNEFLKAVNKFNCMKENKAVDANVQLRDSLKVFAKKRLHLSNNNMHYFFFNSVLYTNEQSDTDFCLCLTF